MRYEYDPKVFEDKREELWRRSFDEWQWFYPMWPIQVGKYKVAWEEIQRRRVSDIPEISYYPERAWHWEYRFPEDQENS